MKQSLKTKTDSTKTPPPIDIDAITSSPKHKRSVDRRIKHIDHDMTAKLAHAGLTHGEIAKLQGCDRSNITRTLQRLNIQTAEVDDYKGARADTLAAMQWRLLQSITAEDIEKASLQCKLMGFGILFDKERLERGQATNINVSAELKLTEQAYKDMLKRRFGGSTQVLDSGHSSDADLSHAD